MIRLVSTKKINAIFLAIVLITGTIAVISPSFVIKGVNAQSEPYYEKDTRYSNYETEPEHRDKDYYSYEPGYPKPPDKKYNNEGPQYPSEYKDKEYNSYEPDYGMDKRYNSYNSQYPLEYKDKNNYNSYKPDHYGMDNDYNKKQYGYESKYQPYGKDDRRDKSKDSNSVNISKIKCENVNNNFNNVVIENLNIGNSGGGGGAAASSNGDSSANVYGNNGERYYDGYQKGKDITCIINNNNTIITGADNATDGNVTLTCEECFETFLNNTQLTALLRILGGGVDSDLTEFCQDLPSLTENFLRQNLELPMGIGADEETVDRIIECLLEAGIEFAPEVNGLNAQGGGPNVLGGIPTAPGGGIFNLP